MNDLVGNKAPAFKLQDTQGQGIVLTSFEGKNNVLLLFFPLAFSSTCTDEMCTMRDNLKLYNAMDAKVLGISVDSFFTLDKFRQDQNLNFTLLSDFNKNVSRKYNVLYDEFYGMQGVSKRAAFIIDKEGVIQYAEVLENAGKLPDFEAIQKKLQNL